jgi:2',3'-cyclic-nucleotide 2'-phosphodiesterase / 3'-nucleotidase
MKNSSLHPWYSAYPGRLRHFGSCLAFAAVAVGAACSSNDGAVVETPPLQGSGPTVADASRPDAAQPDAEVSIPKGATAKIAVLETTDMHSNIRSYDYFKLTADNSIGVERTAALVKQARAEFPNSILVDNGDTIQGTVLADYQALVKPVACEQPIAIYATMNQMGFDVSGIGNHEFNYGLNFLSQVTHTPFDVVGVDTAGNAKCAGPQFPQVLSNVFSSKTGKTLFPPYALVTKSILVATPDGETRKANVKVGVLAFAPPPILNWDKRWLDGKVNVKGVREVTPPLIAQLRAEGADLVIAVIHGGLDNSDYTESLENQAWHLAQIPGVDAMLMGHAHLVFPYAGSTAPQFGLPMVDRAAGTVAGVPALMANFWGQHLGVMGLQLSYNGSNWRIDGSKTVIEARPISSACTGGLPVACDANGRWRTGAPCAFAGMCVGKADKTSVAVEPDPAIAPLVEPAHQATIAYVKTPLGTTDFEMSTYFAEAGDVSAIEIVNQAQADYVSTYVQQNLPQLANLPILSMSAPFKSGFQGGNDYTAVPAGPIAINNAADLYLYANTLYAVKVSGAELKDWLETAATRFAQIDPKKAADQPLINPNTRGYNFDVLTDARFSYEIDLTQPLPATGVKASGRIKNLRFDGRPVDVAAQFIVATNNYRASGGGSFPGLDGSKTIYASPDSNRDILIAYIKRNRTLTRAVNGSHRSFEFSKVVTAGKVVFSSAQNALPKALAAGLTQVSLVQQDDGTGKGLSLYAIGLNP